MCTTELLHGCQCALTFSPVEVHPQPSSPQLPTKEELQQAAADVIRDIWGGKVENLLGFRSKGGNEAMEQFLF